MIRILKTFGPLIIVLGLILWGILIVIEKGGPQGTDVSIAIPIQGQNHIPDGAEHEAYTSNPPTSGPHYDMPARTGFYTEAPPDERLVHNLEHGDIWIAYHPRVSEKIKTELRNLSRLRVIITPREANETDIALVAWGRLDTFNIENDTLPTSRITDFMIRYMNEGPENLPPGPHLEVNN